MQAVIYLRYSTDIQGHGSAQTLVQQEERCREMAARKGWSVIEVLRDEGQSAFKGDHLGEDAELGRFVARLRSGEVAPDTVLIALRLDRLTRRPVAEAMAWIHSITAMGCQIALADRDEVYESNPSVEKFIITALSAGVAHEESRKKSEASVTNKNKLWRLAEARSGKWTNLAGRSAAWLERTPNCDGWIVDNVKADVVRRIYRLSADGIGVATIVKILNADHIAPFGGEARHKRNAPQWGRSHVRQILKSPIVEGDFRAQSGMFVGRVLHGFYPRIVDADVVSTARANLERRRKIAGQPAFGGSANIFSGLVKCGECGRRAFLSTSVQKGRPYPYLRCEAASIEGRCDNRQGYAYRAFEERALDLLLDLALDDRFFEASGDLHRLRIRKAEVEKAIADGRSRRARLLEVFADGDDQIAAMIAEAKSKIDDLSNELGAVEADLQRATGRVSDIEHLKRVGDIREASRSVDAGTRLQARSKLGLAMRTIVSSVELERVNGERVITVFLVGGVMAVRIDTKGRVVKTISEAAGRPLWSYLSAENQAALAPLISRIEKLAA